MEKNTEAVLVTSVGVVVSQYAGKTTILAFACSCVQPYTATQICSAGHLYSMTCQSDVGRILAALAVQISLIHGTPVSVLLNLWTPLSIVYFTCPETLPSPPPR
jgi:hypothetical protein